MTSILGHLGNQPGVNLLLQTRNKESQDSGQKSRAPGLQDQRPVLARAPASHVEITMTSSPSPVYVSACIRGTHVVLCSQVQRLYL